MTLLLQDVSLDRPIGVTFSARLDKQPFSLKGNAGPIGKMLGKGTIPLDLSVRAFEQVDIGLKGNVVDPANQPKFDLSINVSPFSPRKLLAAMGKALPVSIWTLKLSIVYPLKPVSRGIQKRFRFQTVCWIWMNQR